MEVIVATGFDNFDGYDSIKVFRNLDTLRDFIRDFVGTYAYKFSDDVEKAHAMVYGEEGTNSEPLFDITEVLDKFYEITSIDIRIQRVIVQGY